MPERKGASTVTLSNRPTVVSYAAVVGKKEGEGPLGSCFDAVFEDTSLGEDTWEKAESALQREAFATALNKGGFSPSQIQCLFAGDLLNQCVASTFGLQEYQVPFLGQFGACSTMAQTLALAALFVDSGTADLCAAVTSSHFCSAERQFRFPLEYGGQRPPSAQWTATASGCAVVGRGAGAAIVRDVCIGRVTDFGITDANNMGAAMAPAAADTLLRFFRDTRTAPSDYDAVFTGDLGLVGSDLLHRLMAREEADISAVHRDCGLILFDRETQDVHAGGSGCGCSAAVLCGHILPQMAQKKWQNILFVATGALMSPTSSQQGASIPGIAHLLHLTV